MGRVERKAGPVDPAMFIACLALLSIGMVMVFSASSVKAYNEFRDPYHYLKRQLVWALVGLAAMAVTMNIDYRVWRKWAGPIMVLTLAGLGAVLVPGIGTMVAGARRWIVVGPVQVQPSEVCKLSLVIYLAAYLSSKQQEVTGFMAGVLVPLCLLGVCFGLIMLEPDLGMGTTLIGITFAMLFASGVRVSHLVSVVLAGLPLFIAVMVAEPYRRRRLFAFLRPWDDPLGAGFHIIQSLFALGSGGLFGLGLGRSRQKFLYLPSPHTDFIFAVIGEELGFLGTMTVLLLYLVFAWRGYRAAICAPDDFGSLLAVGITSMVVVQALINVGVVTQSLPITGITLPLISFGGSSLTVTLAGIGLLLNVSRYSTGS